MIRKEVRALLPYLAASIPVFIAPLLAGARGAELSWFMYAASCALVGGWSVGQELQHRTLSMLLSQPVSRAAIWRGKMSVLAAALSVNAALFIAASALSLGTSSLYEPSFLPYVPLGWFALLVPLCVFCGAPLLTLLTRSALAGTILCLSPPGLCLTIAMVVHWARPEISEATVVSPLFFAYCASAVVLGYLRFVTHQVRDAGSASLELPPWLVPKISARGPMIALLSKELRLQQGTFLLAVVLWCVFFLAGVITEGGRADLGTIASLVTGVDLLALPIVAGALAVGEETSLGVADWQLTLPPSARVQWLAKMLVTLPISLVLGLFVPLMIWRIAPSLPMLAAFVIGHLLLTHLAIYAASISRGTVPAIVLAFALASALVSIGLYSDLPAKLEAMPSLAFGLAAVLLLLHARAFSNFRRSRKTIF